MALYGLHRIAHDIEHDLDQLLVIRHQFRQAGIVIVLNIVRNAVQAIQGQGDIILRTRIARHVTLAKKNHRMALELKIIDNGPGIPEDIREQIFYPLVTSKADGTGLGLSIAQTYVAHHGGSIDCESQVGHTVFTVLLPYNHLAPH